MMNASPENDPRVPFFDKIAESWDGWHDLNALATELRALLTAFGIQPGETVLDIGCGTGNLTQALLKTLNEDGRVFAADISPGMLKHAQAKIQDPRVTWFLTGADQLPLPSLSCDRILCFSAWPHFTDQATVLRTFHRILRPNGRVHLFHLISRDAVNRIHQQAQNPAVHHDLLVPVAELGPLFERNGFTPLQMIDHAERYLLTAQKKG